MRLFFLSNNSFTVGYDKLFKLDLLFRKHGKNILLSYLTSALVLHTNYYVKSSSYVVTAGTKFSVRAENQIKNIEIALYCSLNTRPHYVNPFKLKKHTGFSNHIHTYSCYWPFYRLQTRDNNYTKLN